MSIRRGLALGVVLLLSGVGRAEPIQLRGALQATLLQGSERVSFTLPVEATVQLDPSTEVCMLSIRGRDFTCEYARQVGVASEREGQDLVRMSNVTVYEVALHLLNIARINEIDYGYASDLLIQELRRIVRSDGLVYTSTWLGLNEEQRLVVQGSGENRGEIFFGSLGLKLQLEMF